ncbi:MAG: UvrD-helicase domain-containing protein [Deltaproteobacteria bacterium]|nr:UvrD-helicase domain-containing protein [Deltaproteobacteria bacterium]
MKVDYQKSLNPAQLEAVMTLNGPVLVIAGAGSGKTRTLVYRVARLIEHGVSPENILLLTFTRKASGEMLERAAGLADERCRFVSGGTFHSLSHQVLRSRADLIGFDRSFTILDRPDMEEIIQSIVKEMDIVRASIRFPRRSTIASILSKAVNLEQNIEALMRDEFSQFLEYIRDIQRIDVLYKNYKRSNQLMDYDDLLIFCRKILAENEHVRKELSDTYQYVMVDEYQDTNGIQADIVKWLATERQNVMVVGDDSQSIYSFRGANYRNMFDFPIMFPETKIIKLEENYRSTQPILTFTNSLMDQAQEKYTKCLFTKRKGGIRPKVVNVKTDPGQAKFISRTILGLLNEGKSLKDMAVLFRAAYHSYELELELTRQAVPFVKYGGFKFMESAHIKDLIAHMRILFNRNDAVSWGRVLRLINNIGQKKSSNIIKWMQKSGVQPWQVGEWPGAGKDSQGLKALGDLLRQLTDENMKPERALELANKYYDPILRERFDDFPKRQKGLEQLINMASRKRKLKAFLDELMLDPPSSNADVSPLENDSYLTLSTVHSAKGLEWPVVFVIWVMEGYFPSSKSRSSLQAIEEERRLMYVAATRAKDKLILCYPGQEELPIWQLAEMGYISGLSSFIQSLHPEVMDHSSLDNNILNNNFSNFSIRKKQPRVIVNTAPFKESSVNSSGLKQGDRVKHPAFGMGVISKFLDKEKVEVLFRDAGRKLLHLEYTTLDKV